MTKRKKWALFDMDDVLTNFAESSHRTLLNLGYPNVPVSEWQDYDITKTYGLATHAEFKRIMIEEGILQNSKPYEDAIDVLRAFRNQGFNTGIITARGWHPKASKITEDYINKHNLPIEQFVIAGEHSSSKLDYLSPFTQSGDILSYLDDGPHHIRDFMNACIPSYLMKRSWITEDEAKPFLQVQSLTEFQEKIFSLYNLNQKSETVLNNSSKKSKTLK